MGSPFCSAPGRVRVLVNIGVSYRRAPLATLDALTLRDLPAFYNILGSIPGIKGAVVVQTCNRVDMFIDAEENVEDNEKILWNWALETKFKLHELRRLAEQRTGDQVLEYLVSLASGLESMLVGESQILGQLKSSLIEARGLAASSPALSKIFEMSIAAGTSIRDQTGIGKGTVSLGSAALKIAERSLGNLNQIKIVFSQLGLFRLIIVATRATGYLLTKDIVLPQLKDQNQKLMILDLSIPRNVSPDLEQLKGVVIKTMDDLRDITDQAVSARKTLVKEAEPRVEEAVKKISALLRRGEAEPMVSDLYHRADKIRKEELEKALSKLDLPRHQQEVLEKMSLSLVRKLLAQPVVNLREAAKKGDSKLLTVAGQIFEGE